HSMGNSTGNLYKYTELFDKYPILQGGFIWDWKDQALRTTTEDGTSYLAYGGDFGESPHDGNFSGDGLVFADGKVSAKLEEVKACYRNVDMYAVDIDKGQFTINNKNLFQTLENYKLVWKVEEEGKEIASGEQKLTTKPESEETITLDYQKENYHKEKEHVITLSDQYIDAPF